MNNKVASTLKTLGIIEAACGGLLCMFFMASGEVSFFITLAVAIIAFVNCVMFMGFAEIINLLQENNDTQAKMLKLLATGEKKPSQPVDVLTDIESNLPKL